MTRIVRITEEQITQIVKKVIKESTPYTEWVYLDEDNIPNIRMVTKSGADVTNDIEIENENTVVAYLKPGKYKPNETVDVQIKISKVFKLTNRLNQETSMTKPVIDNNVITFSFKMLGDNPERAKISVDCTNIEERKLNFIIIGSEDDNVIIRN